MLRFAFEAITGHRLRSALSALGVGIGVAAVMLLTSLGAGTRDHIIAQFSQFGTCLIAINPGKVETMGIPGILGGTTHKLNLEDAAALRTLAGVKSAMPVTMGQAKVEANSRGRHVYIMGVTHDAPAVYSIPVGQGLFLPPIDPRRQGAYAVLGPRVARELFDAASPLGERVRIGGRSFIVVGIMASKGQMLGFDLDDTAYVPVASGMDLFNVDELHEIDVVADSGDVIPRLVEDIRARLKERHRGQEDFTITTQAEILATSGRIIDMVTFAVSAIAGISLLVGAVGILTIMWISIHERTNEIGLLRALGVTPAGIGRLFLLEATVIAALGGFAGIAAALLAMAVVRLLLPDLPLTLSPWVVAAALGMSLIVGLLSGFLPARRAAGLDPVDALRAE
ncbi:MAG: ABC transporter permease [Vicinamibacteria bacterium]|jgi:putative ABC transport system permease protein|nr:ABC transporter permease [Vicinamibacteria bacterium]